MNTNRVVSIDGHKPVECMNDEEKNQFFLDKFGMTFEKFVETNPPHSDDDTFFYNPGRPHS